MSATSSVQEYGTIGLMVGGLLALTVGADVAPDPELSAGLAIVGGLVIAIGGVWGFRNAEKQGEYDERYLKIWLRGGALSLWVFYWAVAILNTIDRTGSVATPVLEPTTWLMLVPWVTLFGTVWYYERVM